jgi:hypothetical protein
MVYTQPKPIVVIYYKHKIDFFFFCSYTWKIYATKVLNMGSIYGFWRQLNKEQRQAKQRYLQLFYNLQFRRLVSSKKKNIYIYI